MFGIHYIRLRLWITAERGENISTRSHQINLCMLKHCGDKAAKMTAVTSLVTQDALHSPLHFYKSGP